MKFIAYLPNDDFVVVDGFMIFKIIWEVGEFGSKVFLASANLDSLAKELALGMVDYVASIVPCKNHFTWVFDGRERELEKIGLSKKRKTEARLLNKAMNLYHLSTMHGAKGSAKEIFNKRFVFSSEFFDFVLATIQQQVGHQVFMAPGEADFAIAKICNDYPQRVVVLSSDADYLTFTKCKGVICPRKDQRAMYNREKVLQHLGCTANELMVAVCYNGQDHVKKVSKFSIKRCLTLFRKSKENLVTLEQLFDCLAQEARKSKKDNPDAMIEETSLCKEQGMRLIKLFQKGTNCIAIKSPDPEKLNGSMPEWKKFVLEKDEKGVLRRPLLKAKVIDGVRPVLHKKNISHEQFLLNQRVARYKQATERVEKKSIKFNFNVFRLQEHPAYKFTEKELNRDEDDDDDDEYDEEGDEDDDDQEGEEDDDEQEENGGDDHYDDDFIVAAVGEGKSNLSDAQLELFKQQALHQVRCRDFGSMDTILLPVLKDNGFSAYASQAVKNIKVTLMRDYKFVLQYTITIDGQKQYSHGSYPEALGHGCQGFEENHHYFAKENRIGNEEKGSRKFGEIRSIFQTYL